MICRIDTLFVAKCRVMEYDLNKLYFMGELYMETKRVTVANFNIVFANDKNEYPMLDYFDSIVMPALKADIIWKSGDNKFLLNNIKIKRDNREIYVLTGNIIKKTTLEIISDLNENGELVEKDEMHSSAPYSTFVIYLNNHRMILVENQKGSPSIANFRSLVRYLLSKFVKNYNKNNKDSKLPEPLVNIVGIPRKENIENILRNANKINKLTLRFYPLNGDGDIDLSEAFGILAKDARKILGANTGNVSYNSPKNTNGIIEVLSKSNGTVEPIFSITDKDNAKTIIKEDQITETRSIEMDGECFENENNIIAYGRELESIKYRSEENENIYQRNKEKISKYF